MALAIRIRWLAFVGALVLGITMIGVVACSPSDDDQDPLDPLGPDLADIAALLAGEPQPVKAIGDAMRERVPGGVADRGRRCGRGRAAPRRRSGRSLR